jgi:ribose/xylose/arabinose/galactoside ABC-type transport system permease subunit
MRHLIGIVLAVVMAAAVFFAAGWGIQTITVASETFTSHSSGKILAALAALAGTGLLLGILVSIRRISPLAAGLPGIMLLAWSALYAFDTLRAVRLVPLQRDAFGEGFADLLTFGVTALLGAVMIIPIFIPSRWRRRPGDDDYADITSGIGLMR